MGRDFRLRAGQRARRARRELAVLVPLVAGVLLVYAYRVEIFGVDTPVRILAGVALVVVGWTLARTLGLLVTPPVEQRDIDTRRPVGFAVRFLTIGVAFAVAVRLV